MPDAANLSGNSATGSDRKRRVPLRHALLVAAAGLVVGLSYAEAAYRLSFKNGTSVEVPSYEDVGDSIRYPRLGGVVAVPKANVSAIEEAIHLPAPATPAPVPAAPTSPAPHVTVPTQKTPQPTAVPQPQGSKQKPAEQFASDPARVTASAMAPFVLLMFGLAVLVLLARLLISRLASQDTELPYQKVDSVLTAAERSFHGVLYHAVEGRLIILAKVRLADLFELPAGTLNRFTYRNKIDRKHVDFVLCGPDDLTPLLAIELDDASHERRDRRERDAFVDRVFDAAGLPLLRVPARRTYAPRDLRGLIDERLPRLVTLDVLDELPL